MPGENAPKKERQAVNTKREYKIMLVDGNRTLLDELPERAGRRSA
jgi:hypothetical protein